MISFKETALIPFFTFELSCLLFDKQCRKISKIFLVSRFIAPVPTIFKTCLFLVGPNSYINISLKTRDLTMAIKICKIG